MGRGVQPGEGCRLGRAGEGCTGWGGVRAGEGCAGLGGMCKLGRGVGRGGVCAGERYGLGRGAGWGGVQVGDGCGSSRRANGGRCPERGPWAGLWLQASAQPSRG